MGRRVGLADRFHRCKSKKKTVEIHRSQLVEEIAGFPS